SLDLSKVEEVQNKTEEEVRDYLNIQKAALTPNTHPQCYQIYYNLLRIYGFYNDTEEAITNGVISRKQRNTGDHQWYCEMATLLQRATQIFRIATPLFVQQHLIYEIDAAVLRIRTKGGTNSRLANGLAELSQAFGGKTAPPQDGSGKRLPRTVLHY